MVVQSPEADAIRTTLAKGELPGAVADINLPTLATLIRQCWRAEPLLRPTAADVATKLLEISLNQVTRTENPSQPREDTTLTSTTAPIELPIAGINALNFSEYEIQLLNYIQSGRIRYTEKDSNPPTDKLSVESFRLFIDDSRPWDAAKYFLVGAAILWDLVDCSIEDLEGTDAILTGSRSEIGIF